METIGVKNQLPKLITPKELKAYLGCNNNRVYELVNRRDFPSFRIGGKYYIIYDDFINWMKNQTRKVK